MAYKNQKEIDQVKALINNLEKGEYLNASTIALRECNMFLSTHKDCGYFITNPLRARQAELINADLKEIPFSVYGGDLECVSICPSQITSGMLITQHGYIGKVECVDRYESKELGVINESEPFVYVVRMTYVSGDLDMHKYFTRTINNGCAKGYLSAQQGNRLATFTRVLTD